MAVLLPLLWSATAEASEQVFDASVKLSSPHCAQFGVSYHSSSSWRADASSALQCQRSCAASDQPCRNFTFHLDSKLCVLLGGEAMVNQDAHAISGPKDCAPLVGSEPMNSTQPLLFVRGALQFNGPGALFEAAVQASLFAAQHTAEEAKDFRAAMVIKKMGPDPYQSFADLDRNSNGVLERDEFVNVSSKLLPLWEVQRAFAQMDRNKDWKLDLGEYTQASHDPGDSAEQVLAEAAGAARRLAQRSGLPAAQQEILAAAAAARHAAQMAEVNGEDLRTQALRASEGVQLAVALPPSELAALRCLAVSFAASSAASASAAEEAAHQAAWPAIVATSAWDESQRKDASAYVAGITAGLQAQAHHAQNVTQAIEKAVLKALGGPPEPSTANAVAAETAKTADAVAKGWEISTATENRAVIHSIQAPQKTATTGTPPSQMVQQIARAMAAGWRVENARNFSDPAAANLVWVGDAFSQAFHHDARNHVGTAAMRAAEFLEGVTTDSKNQEKLQQSASAALEEKQREGASVVEQAVAAAAAVEKSAKEMKKNSQEEERLALGALGAAVRLGAPQMEGPQLAHLAEEAAQKGGFTDAARAEVGAWAAATGASEEEGESEISADTAAAAARGDEELNGVKTAAASVALDRTWRAHSDLGALMRSEETFEKEMSLHLGSEELIRQTGDPDKEAAYWVPLWLPILGLGVCCLGAVIGLFSWKQKKTKPSSRCASLGINYAEIDDALVRCKDPELGSEASPQNAEKAASPRSDSLASPTSAMSPAMPDLPEVSRLPVAEPRPGMLPGPLLMSYPDWQQSWQPGEQREVNYQVPPGARPGATLLVDVGGGLAVPTLVPESAYPGLTLTLRR